MIALAVLAAQYAGTLELLDTTRLDSRGADPSEMVTVGTRQEKIVLAADASSVATARVHLKDRRWDFTLANSPSVTLPDLELVPDDVMPGIKDPAWLDTGSASVGWHDTFTSLTVFEAASYGKVVAALPYQAQAGAQVLGSGQAAGGAQAGAAQGGTATGTGGTGMMATPGQAAAGARILPEVLTLSTGSTYTSAYFAQRFGRRVTLTVSGGYSLSGGLDAISQTALPLEFGPFAATSLNTTVSKADTLSTAASGQQVIARGSCVALLPLIYNPAVQMALPAQTLLGGSNAAVLQCRTDSSVAQAQEVLRHQLSRTATLSVGAGVGIADFNPGTGRKLAITPAGGVAYTQHFGTDGTTILTVSAQFAPVVDVLTGEPSDRVLAVGSLTRPVMPHTVVILSANFLRALPGLDYDNKYPITAVGVGVEARMHVSRLLDVSVGEQEYWQDQPNFGPAQSVSLGYVSVTGRAPTLHF